MPVMDEKYNESTPQRPQGDRILDAPLVTMDLVMYMQQIREEQAWKEGDRNAITIFKTGGMTIVLVALHAGAALTRHTANGIISVQVLEGQISFKTDDQSVSLDKGQVLTLHEGIAHSVEAISEAVFLLTVANSSVKNTIVEDKEQNMPGSFGHGLS